MRISFAALLTIAFAASGCGNRSASDVTLRPGVTEIVVSLRCDKDAVRGEDGECKDMNPGTYAPPNTGKPPPAPPVPSGGAKHK